MMVATAWRYGFAAAGLLLAGQGIALAAGPELWRLAWPRTNFDKRAVDLEEIRPGGPPKDGIPAIDNPKFVTVGEVADLVDTEPVVAFGANRDQRAYPLRILIWHEIVNDTVEGVPVTITYCPLCNSSVVFDRRVEGRVLDFGTTGNLRHSDLVMYDRQTESWWQQFMGEGIVGEYAGKTLRMLPSRVESFARFKARAPQGKVLVANDPAMRPYGNNPYSGYDSRVLPYPLFSGEMPKGIEPMARVVAVGDEAWSLALLRAQGSIAAGELVLRWEAGQNSALDSPKIAKGADVGNVTVQRRVGDRLEDAVHDVTFAFVFHAFRPKGVIHQ